MNGELMAINLSLEFEEIFRIQDALQYQQHRSCNSKAREYWEDHFDDVVKDIKEYTNSKVKKPIEDRESSNFYINTNGEEN